MDGSLILRETVKFGENQVINYVPKIPDNYFEGSIEVEVFSIENMVIPYAGISVIYQSEMGISLTHTYSRSYSNHEIEDGNIMPICNETCCHTLLSANKGSSYFVLHNGNQRIPEQEITLELLNFKGERKIKKRNLKSLNPYQTIKIDPKEYFEDYEKILDEKPGNLTIEFSLNKTVFPRLLCVNESNDKRDFQVNHSNFNLSRIIGSKVDDEFGYNNWGCLEGVDTELIIYPDCEDGKFEALYEKKIIEFDKDKITSIKLNPDYNYPVKFRKINDKLPLRIHTGVRVSKPLTNRLPSETCRGIWHSKSGPKRFFWIIVSGKNDIDSRIIVRPFKDDVNIKLNLKLYSAHNNQILENEIYSSVMKNGITLDKIFPNSKKFLKNSYGWLTIFSNYEWFDVTGTLENKFGSIGMEHSF